MVLRDYCNILFLLLWTFTISYSQETEVRCINPQFDQLVDGYLDYSIPVISVADAYESKDKYIFLDARELDEYNTSHIEQATHIGYNNFEVNSLKMIPKHAQIIIYCSIGYRSEKIGEVLKNNGFENVYNLYGSIFEWVNQHHPVYDFNGNSTFQLHTYNKKWSKWVEVEGVEKIWKDWKD